MISLDEARRYVFSFISPLEPVRVEVGESLGRVAAESMLAVEPVPGFANSSMDGFALRSSDTADSPVTLKVIDLVLAGGVSGSRVNEGEAVRIMTGAPLPEGADCVEMIEEVELDNEGSYATIHRRIDAGNFVRRPGDDINVGDQLIAAGDVLSATRLGVLASQGVETVLVYPKVTVGVLSTGNELASTHGALAPGSIRDVNRPLLLALLRDAGATPIDLGVVRDDHELTRRAIVDAVDACDVVITTGGVSAGDVDYVKVVISELAPSNARSMQVAVRPGKPFAFGVVEPRHVPVFGLPGNPVSTRTSFEMFVRPALMRMGGHAVSERLMVDAVLDCAMERSVDGKVHLVHVTAAIGDDARVHVVAVTREGSHLLHAVASANAIAAVPDGHGLAIGDSVPVMVLRPEELSTSSFGYGA